MSGRDAPLLDAAALKALAQAHGAAPPCPNCAALACPGWEAVPATFDRAALRRVGTLRRPDDEDPTLAEYHPEGTNAWSADAPIAPAFFPYNRCEAWQCVACARPFLRYTEYGGYYQEERIRELRADLVVDVVA
ncbi:MAG TPA: hypothetical protein VLJ86_07185 [Ramlibacter sp.]|nr:hypothetical protein [Ramlibacter sp.]